MAAKKRATTEKDKLKKKEKLLRAAWMLYQRAGGQLPTVTRIAQRAKLSKGCVYLYFRTKEEIFLELYFKLLSDHFDAISEELDGLRGGVREEDLARIVTRYVLDDPLHFKMGSQVRGIFEENIEDARLLEIKNQLGELVEGMGERLSKRVQGLSRKRAVKLLVNVHALMMGLWQFTNTVPRVRDKLAENGVTMYDIDFEKDLLDAVAALIRGFLMQSA